MISRLTSTPFIASISGLGPAFNADNKYNKIRLWTVIKMLKFIFSRKDVSIICQNSNDSKILLSYGIISDKKIFLIHGSGVDLNYFSPNKKKKLSEKYILMSSRILFDKGIREYCLAAKIVKKKLGDSIKFKLSGPLDYTSPTSISKFEINKIVSKYGVNYLGNREDMPELLASAEIFVFPSYYPEGLPKVLLEAAACGTPIITTDHPGCRDAVINNETGILVPIKDPDTLAKTIIKLISERKIYENMKKKSRTFAETSFDVSLVVDKHYSLYRKTLR